MKGIDKTANQLLEMIFTAAELKKVSVYIESLTQSTSFKTSIKKIATDEDLTDAVKKTEMLKLLDGANQPTVFKFFEKMFDNGQFWLFSSDHFDYFDQFVQSFQMQTEDITLLHLVTAVEVKEIDLEKISKNLSEGFGQHVLLHIQVDPKVLGGAQIRMGNLVFDYTLKAKFAQFKRQWINKLTQTSELVGRE